LPILHLQASSSALFPCARDWPELSSINGQAAKIVFVTVLVSRSCADRPVVARHRMALRFSSMARAAFVPRREIIHPLPARLLLLAVGFLFACLLSESALRIGGYGRSYFNVFSMFFEVDDLVGVRGRPNFTGRLKNDEMDALISNDTRGFRQPAREIPASPERRKVVVLGDSFIWGWGVGQGQVITDLIQNRLVDRRVQNLAIASIGTVQEFVIFEKYVLSQLHRGDAVVLGFCGVNDFLDNLGKSDTGRLHATLVDGQIHLVPPDGTACPSRLNQRLRDSSVLINLLIYSWNRGRDAWRKGSFALASQNGPTVDVAAPRDDVSREVADAQRSAIQIADQEPYAENTPEVVVATHYLRAFQSACAARGARFVIVYVPRQEEFGELVEYKGPAFSSRDRQTLRLLAKRLGIDVIDLLPRFRACKRQAPQQRLTFVEGHWNATGHQVACDSVCEYLIAR
jgi:hypothetical protein